MDLKIKAEAFIIYSNYETNRKCQVDEIIKIFPNCKIIDSIYPEYTRVPFLNKIIKKSKSITGKELLKSEIGVILSHRKIWKIIRNKNTKENVHYYIFESDSKIHNIMKLNEYYESITNNFDLFFWGAWNGNSVIKNSTILFKNSNFKVGTPFLETIYGAYAYSLNSQAAKCMLSKTSNILHPIDIFKKYLQDTHLRIGSISPEIIGTWQTTKSNIRNENKIDLFYRFIIMKLFYMFYSIKSYFY